MLRRQKLFISSVVALSAFCALLAAHSPAQTSPASAAVEKPMERMRSLSNAEKYRELVDLFKDADLAKWPDPAQAFFMRGRAYLLLKDSINAERDLEACVKREPKEGWYWYNLAEIYRGLRRDNARTVDAYKKAVELDNRRGWMPADAALKAADILLHEVKTDQALEILDFYTEEDLEAAALYWRVRILRMRARVLAAQGKEREALDGFRRALVIEGSA